MRLPPRPQDYIGGLDDLNRGLNLHFQSCGHYIHLSCFASYFKSLQQNEQVDRTVQREQQRIDLKRGLFLCPMCRQIANTLVPLLPDDLTRVPGTQTEPCDEAAIRECTELFAPCESDAHLAPHAEPAMAAQSWRRSNVGDTELGATLTKLGRELMGFASQDQTRQNRVFGPRELLQVLVSGIGTTIGCLELSTRDPLAAAPGAEDQVGGTRPGGRCFLQRRALSDGFLLCLPTVMCLFARHLTSTSCDLFCARPRQVLPAYQRVLNVLDSMSRVALHERGGWEGVTAAECGDEALELLRSLLAPKVRALLAPKVRHGGAGEGEVGEGEEGEGEELPLLCRDMYSTLVRLVYMMPHEAAVRHRGVLRRACFLAACVQAFVAFHLKGRARGLVGGPRRAWGDSGPLAACLREELGGDALGDVLEWDTDVLARWLPEPVHDAAPSSGGLNALLADCVRACTHSFLRKSAMLYHVRYGEPLPDAARGRCGQAEWDSLARCAGLQWDPATLLPPVGGVGLKLASLWAAELRLCSVERRQELLPASLPPPATAGFPLMVTLPELYHDLYMSYRDQQCKFCREVPHRPALCLICGELVCFASECCRRVRVPGASDSGIVCECFSHAVECGAGTGIFMLLKTSMVLLIRESHWCIWGSPYLDAYGEEDAELKRGRPLHLNRERYQQLQLLHSTVGFDHNSRVANSWLTGAQRY